MLALAQTEKRVITAQKPFIRFKIEGTQLIYSSCLSINLSCLDTTYFLGLTTCISFWHQPPANHLGAIHPLSYIF